MASCPKCGNETFKAEEVTVKGFDWRYKAVMCSSCEHVITILPYEETNYLILCLAKALKIDLDKVRL